jgi:hypothetical protein
VGLPSPDATAVFVYTALFALLSPGLLLTLPALSPTDCGADGKHIFDEFEGDDTFCDAIGTINDDTPKCKKCTSWNTSGFTGVVPVLVHSLVFGSAAYFISKSYL